MKVQAKHGKVTQNMHGASRNYRYVWDVSVCQMVLLVTVIVQEWDLLLHNEEILTLGPLGMTVSILVWPDAL